MNNPIIYQAVGGLLLLFFFYLTYMNTKTWRWVHVTALFFVFVAAIFVCIFAAVSVLTHTRWKAVAGRQAVQARQLAEERDELLYGDLTQVIQSDPSIRSLNADLGRVLLDRGRVWQNAVPSPPAQDGSITVSTGDAAPNRISEQMVLYAFIEEPAPPEAGLPANTKVPRYYVAEFTAAAVTDNSVTLQPTIPLTNLERNVIGQGLNMGATWSLYETMPIDGHKIFSTEPLEKPDWNKPASEEPVFGPMDPQMIARLFAPFQPSPDNQAAVQVFQNMVQPYLRDGKLANPEQDPPDNIWAKVRFKRAHKEVVDSDATLGAVMSSQDFFDRGRANVPLLQRGGGGEAEFAPGDVGIFPQADASRLVNQEIAELMELIFVRDLQNYEQSFRQIALRAAKLNQDTARIQRDTTAVTETNGRTVEQIQFREQEKAKLQADLAKFQYEQNQIQQYAESLNQAWDARRAELSRLYRENLQLAQELARLEEQLTREINQRTLEAVSASP